MSSLKSSIDMEQFWKENAEYTRDPRHAKRVPVELYMGGGDWLCERYDLDNYRYYNDYEYQQKAREQGRKVLKEEMAYDQRPGIDFGVIMDASIYGGEPQYPKHATPVLKHVVEDPDDIDALIEKMQKADPLECGLIPRALEWRENIRRDYGVNLMFGGSLKGCATMMGQILGITNFLTWIITDPEPIHRLIDCWYETSVRYLRAMRKETGFVSNGYFEFASDVAGMLSPQLYDEFIKDKEKLLYQEFAPNPDDRRRFHGDYHMVHLLPALKEIGVTQVNIDPYVDCNAIWNVFPEVTVVGQIPPTSVLLYGSPEDVKACVKRDIEQANGNRKLIISTAGSINPGTSFENLRAVCEAVVEYGSLE